jgi:hypothetical protein
VEVRSRDEILATLDEHGRLEGLPFMPEMLQFCGRRFRVQSRAHKTCDTILASGFRRMENAVHLSELRCDGASHGGCQAACLLFWKTAWLRSVDESSPAGESAAATENRSVPGVSVADARPMEVIAGATRGTPTAEGDTTYSCQATELRVATSELHWLDVRQYAHDLESRNVNFRRFARGILLLLLNKFQAANRRYLPRLTLISEGRRYPFVAGKLEGKTPKENLNLQPGEFVRIKSKEEIEETLDRDNKNRGLLFDGVMSKYCGETAKVRARVTKIINERTGVMIHFENECIMLDGVVCTGDYMQFCPRRIYDYWREIWLERV